MDKDKVEDLMRKVIKIKAITDKRNEILDENSRLLNVRTRDLDAREKAIRYRELRLKKILQDKKLEV